MRHSSVALTSRSFIWIFLVLSMFGWLTACARTAGRSAVELPRSDSRVSVKKEVVVSYYGEKFAGRKTASGEVFNPNLLTAAHRSKPFGTKVRLRNPKNGKEVTLRINDRGPFIPGRTYDISEGAAKQLGILEQGVATLEEIAP